MLNNGNLHNNPNRSCSGIVRLRDLHGGNEFLVDWEGFQMNWDFLAGYIFCYVLMKAKQFYKEKANERE